MKVPVKTFRNEKYVLLSTIASLLRKKERKVVKASKEEEVIYEEGVFRIIAKPDVGSDLENLKGDMFDPEVNPELSPEELKKEEKDFEKKIEREGVWGFVLEQWNPQKGIGWEELDGVWGFVGIEDDHYIVDEYKAKIKKLQKKVTSSFSRDALKLGHVLADFKFKFPKVYKGAKEDLADGLNMFYIFTAKDGKKFIFLDTPGHGWIYTFDGVFAGEEDGGFDVGFKQYQPEFAQMMNSRF